MPTAQAASPCRMPLQRSIRMQKPSGAGSTCFPPRPSRRTRAAGQSAATTAPTRRWNGPSRRPPTRPTSRSGPPAIPFVTRSPPTCCRTAQPAPDLIWGAHHPEAAGPRAAAHQHAVRPRPGTERRGRHQPPRHVARRPDVALRPLSTSTLTPQRSPLNAHPSTLTPQRSPLNAQHSPKTLDPPATARGRAGSPPPPAGSCPAPVPRGCPSS